MQGPLANVSQALRDGFLAAHLQARQAGQPELKIDLYDSTAQPSLDSFYQQALAKGTQLVIGPLEKDMVRQLASRSSLPITTLALNYSEADQQMPPQLFQFGLAAEDEAREAADRAWADGHRRAIALAPRGEWGARVLDAFNKRWQSLGGTTVAAEPLAEPVQLANQIADLLQLRASESRAQRLQNRTNQAVAAEPSRRQDVDFIFPGRNASASAAGPPHADIPVRGGSARLCDLACSLGNPQSHPVSRPRGHSVCRDPVAPGARAAIAPASRTTVAAGRR